MTELRAISSIPPPDEPTPEQRRREAAARREALSWAALQAEQARDAVQRGLSLLWSASAMDPAPAEEAREAAIKSLRIGRDLVAAVLEDLDP